MAVKRCSCEHKWQDKRYGKGKRVFNEFKTQNGTGAKCTVCGSDGSGGTSKRR